MKPFYPPEDDPPSGGRRLLLLSYHFPPSSAAGALRWRKLSRFAAERGWGVDVITLDPSAARTPDWNRLAELPAGTRVCGASHPRIWIERLDDAAGLVLRGLRWLRRVGHRAPAADPMAPAGPELVVKDQVRWHLASLDGWARAFHAWLHFARERAWGRAALSVGRALLVPGVHRAVISCGPPHMSHEAGWRLAAEAGLPFVMDLRDPWLAAPVVATWLASPVWLRLAARHEGRAVREAALVVTNTPQLRDAMQAAYPDVRTPIIAVMNGYDDEPLPAVRPDPRFLIAFAGSIYIDRDPRPLFRAAGRVMRELQLTPDRFGIEFIGHVERYGGVPVLELARQEGLEGFVRTGGPRPRSEAMEFLARATMLVSLPQDVGLAIPSKIFEYMQFDAWLLVLAKRGSATELLLRGTAADVVDPEDHERLSAVLAARYRQFVQGERPQSLALEGRFSRRAQAQVLFDAIEHCVTAAR